MNLKQLFAGIHVTEPRLKALVEMSENIKTDVERAIEDKQVFKDSDYRILEDHLTRALINVEIAADLFNRRFHRKTARARKFTVKEVIIEQMTSAEQKKLIKSR